MRRSLRGHESGQQGKRFIDGGELAADPLVVSMLFARFNGPDCDERGSLLDGFPRTGGQAESQ